MSDPTRLLDDPGVASETKSLLGALEAPSPLAPSLRSAIGARVTNSLVAPAAAKVTSLTTLGWLAGAIVASGVGIVTWTRFEAPEPQPAPAAVEVRAQSPRAEAPPAPPPVTVPAVPEPPEPTPKAAQKPAARRDTLAIEESLLEQARRAIGSPPKALALLRDHERRFPNGELTAERLYLTAQVQARAGNVAAARRSAAALQARFPKSTYLPRLRSLLEQ